MRRLLLALLTATATALVPVFAHAAVQTDEVAAVAEQMRSGQPVVSVPGAENALTGAQVDDLTTQVIASEVPIFIGVFPESTAGTQTTDDVLIALNEQVGLGGVYAVVVGDQFRAGSTSGSASDLATRAFQAESANGVPAVLSEFIALSTERFAAGGTAQATPSEPSAASGVFTFFLLALFIGVIALLIVVLLRSRKKAQAQLAEVKAAVDQDVTEFGERLARFDITNPDFDAQARADLQRALDDYDRAKRSAQLMTNATQAEQVTSALEDGRYSLACVQAQLAGEPAPERRAPCFVDPRHGPSVADVLWTPPGMEGAAPRDVPMCRACETAVADGYQPAAREVEIAGGQRPYWQAGRHFGGYAMGYYAPFTGIMTGLFMGSMLGGM
ncbi:MAG TPA: hypothetical protein VGP37_11705, partial [Candidatus Nanopelagicales bacterium]|nr:hypothetical protein [Candidatus Nanopelagicales bacterium]